MILLDQAIERWPSATIEEINGDLGDVIYEAAINWRDHLQTENEDE